MNEKMTEKNNSVLSGVRVLDLTHLVAGPFASLYMAMFGAEVIKIENPRTKGGMNRHTGPFVNDFSLRFCALNHNKKSVVIDLSKSEGREIFLQMVAESDVVIENFRYGVMERLGLDFEALKKVNPKIVYGSVKGFGSTGPYRDLPAYDVIAQAMSGVMWLNGREEDPPMKVGTSIGDVIAGINLTIGVLAALRKAEVTGEGCCVEISLVDSLVSSLMMDQITALNFGQVPKRIGNNYREWCPYGTYQAMDGYYVIGAGSDAMFRTLATEILKKPEMASSPQFARQDDRVRNRAEVDKAIYEWSSHRSVKEICDELTAWGIPCAKVNNTLDVISDEHIAGAHDLFPTYVQPDVGNVRVTDIPIRFPGMEKTPLVHAPRLGEQTAEVFRDLLHMQEKKLCELEKKGVISLIDNA